MTFVIGTNAVAQSFEATPTTIAIPDGPGSIQGMGERHEVLATTGAVAWTLPLPVPAGEGGFAPSLSISYSSSAPNGELGVGWSLGLPVLCRRTDAGFPAYGGPYDGDAFLMRGAIGSGDLVPVPDWNHDFALQHDGSFIRARPGGASRDGWTVRTPDGVTHHFGDSSAARQGPDPTSFEGTSCWFVERQRDQFGHEVVWHYERDDGTLYPRRAVFAVDTASPRWIEFEYEARGDVFTDWRAGFRRVVSRRLSTISMDVEDSGVRTVSRVALSYDEHWNASRLIRIGVEGEFGEALPGYEFAYGSFVPGAPTVESFVGPALSPSTPGVRLVDLTGNGLPDLLRANASGWSFYRNDGAGFSVDAEPVVTPPSFRGDLADWILLDFDGDGLRDVVHRDASSGRLRVWRNASPLDGYTVRFDYLGEQAIVLPVRLDDGSILAADLNLDRRIDFLHSRPNGSLASAVTSVERDADLAVRAGSGVVWDGLVGVGERLPGWASSGVMGVAGVDLSSDRVHLADVNGDGLDDLVRVVGTSASVSIVAHEAVGYGGFGPAAALTREVDTLGGIDPGTLRIIDVNGDGLADVVSIQQARVQLWLNRAGISLDGPHIYELPERNPGSVVVLADGNGNGTVDFVVVDPATRRWTVIDPSGDEPTGLLVSVTVEAGATQSWRWASLRVAQRRAEHAGYAWRRVAPFPGPVVIESHTGTLLGWRASTDHDYVDPFWDRNRGTFRTFEGASVRLNGAENAEAIVADYTFHVGGDEDWSGLGPWFGDENRTFGGLASEALAGRPRSVVVRTDTGALLSQQLSTWDVRVSSGHRVLVVPAETARWQPEGGAAAPRPGTAAEAFDGHSAARSPAPGEASRQYTRTRYSVDAWGHVSEVSDLGFVDAAGADIPGDERSVQYQRIHDEERWLLGRVAERRLVDSSGEPVGIVRTFYDGEAFVGLPLGRLTHGIVTRQAAWFAEESRWVDTGRFERDRHGNVIASLDALRHRIEVDWDPTLGVFPVRERQRLDTGSYAGDPRSRAVDAIEVAATWDIALGVMTGFTDANGQRTDLVYDGLGRPISLVRPGDTHALPTTTWSYEVGSPISWLEVRTRRESGLQPVDVQRVGSDGLGRIVASLAQVTQDQWHVGEWNQWGPTGQVVRAWNPWTQTGNQVPASPPEGQPYVDFHYDASGRLVESRLQDGETRRTEYLAGSMRLWDANDLDPTSPHVATPDLVELDGLGRTRRVVQTARFDGSEDLVTHQLEFDAADRVTRRVLPDGTERAWTWDSLGRRTTVVDDHAGLERRGYDDVGNPISEWRATGAVVSRAYDPAGRLLQVDHQDPGIARRQVVRYDYDRAHDSMPGNNLVGRLSRAVDSTGTTWFDYDARGERVREFNEYRGTVRTTGRRYDAAGRLAAVIYSDGSAVGYEFDGLSRVVRVRDLMDGMLLIASLDHDPLGGVVSAEYGNGVVQTATFDEQGRPVEGSVVSSGGTALMDVRVERDAAGIARGITDLLSLAGPLSLSVTYEHDSLRRLRRMSSAGYGSMAWSFDGANSLLSRRHDLGVAAAEGLDMTAIGGLDVELFVLGGDTPAGTTAGPHHVTGAGDRWLGYDESGNLTVDIRPSGERRYEWNADGALRSVRLEDGREVVMAYDGTGRRVERALRTPDGDVVRRTMFLNDLEQLEWLTDRTQHRKTLVVGEARVLEVMDVNTSTGEPLDDFRAPRVAPWVAVGTTPVMWRLLGHHGARPPPAGSDSAPYVGLSGLVGGILLAIAALLLLFVAGLRPVGRARRIVAATTALALVLAPLPACGPDGHGERWSPSVPFFTADSDVAWLHGIVLGTPVVTTDRAGQADSRSVVTPDGVRVAHVGARSDRFVFTDKERDADTGLIHFGTRNYDPHLGRWISVDPYPLWADDGYIAPTDANALAYVGGRMTNAVDRNGEYAEGAVEAVSISIGLASYQSNIARGNYGAAAVDAVGVIADAIAMAVPVVPGVVSLSVAGARGGHSVATALVKARGATLEAATAVAADATRRLSSATEGPAMVDAARRAATEMAERLGVAAPSTADEVGAFVRSLDRNTAGEYGEIMARHLLSSAGFGEMMSLQYGRNGIDFAADLAGGGRLFVEVKLSRVADRLDS